MSRHEMLTHRTADCHWSVPACLFHSMSESDDDVEKFWVCERTEQPRRVSQAECSKCRNWSPEHGRTPAKGG